MSSGRAGSWVRLIGLIVVVVALSGCSGKSPKKPPTRGRVPIVASGGSIKFISLTPWNCNSTKTRCITTPSGNLGHVDSEQAADWGGEATIQRRPWQVNFQPFPGGTTPGASDVLGLCPTNTTDLDTAICGSADAPNVLVKTFEGTTLVSSSVAGSYTIQYFDPHCSVHGKTNARGFDDPPLTLPVCEHPKTVTFLIDDQSASHEYTCLGGVCQVYFYK